MTNSHHHHHRRGDPGLPKRGLYIFLGSLVATILVMEFYSGLFGPGGGGAGDAGTTLPEALSAARMAASVDADTGSSRPLPPRPQERKVPAEPRQPHVKPMEEEVKPVLAPPKAEEKPAAAAAAAAVLPKPKDPPASLLPPNREARCLAQDWVVKHKQLQDDMLAGKKTKRFLVVRPDCGYCGMCNRLNAIIGTYLLAVLTDRALVIDWRYPGKYGWQDNTNYLDPHLVDWKAQSAVGADTFDWPENKTLLLHGWNEGATIRDMLKVFKVFPDTMDVEENEAIILVYMGISPAESLKINPEARKRAVAKGLMTEDTVWDEDWDQQFAGCALRALFQPSKILQDFYCQLQGEGPGKGIGVHVRTGDDRTWNEEHANPTDEHFRFARCAEGMRQAMVKDYYTKEGFRTMAEAAVAKGGRRVDVEQWHVASDYQQVVDDVRKRFPARVASMDTFETEEMKQTGNIRVHSANTAHQQFPLGALLDLIQLSSTLAVVGTCRSTFSAAAGYFGMLPNEFTLLKRTNFEMRYFHSTDCPRMPKEDEAEIMCRELLVSSKDLVEDVLRTPAFITCPVPSSSSSGGGGGGKR